MTLALADRILTGSPTHADRLDHAFRIVLSRLPSAAERSRLDALLHDRLTHYRADPGAAAALLRNANFVYRPSHSDQPELAAWFSLATVLLNLDETMTKP
jgi:hypothetical protein